MKTNLREEFDIGEVVVLDKDFNNSSEVTVVSQTIGRLFTRVKNENYVWDVMSNRLTKKKED